MSYCCIFLLIWSIHVICCILSLLHLQVKHKIILGKCGALVKWRKVNQEGVGSNLPPGGDAFETFQNCRRSSTFLKACKKSLIFIVKFSSGMPKTFSDTNVNWSCVTRCRCRTTSSNFFTVCVIAVGEGGPV